MKKLALLTVAFIFALALFLPGRPDAPAAIAAASEQGLFEAAAYKETQLKRRADGHFYVTAYVNGTPITFLIDTGATVVALTQDDARAVGIDFSPDEFVPIARTANGLARGKEVTLGKVAIEGKEATEIDAVVMENGFHSLLGQAYLSRITGVQMNGDYMILR